MDVAFGADRLRPHGLLHVGAAISLDRRPWPRERVVDGGDLVDQDLGIGLVEMDALLEDAFIVPVKRQAGGVIDAGTSEAAGLDFERVVAAVAVGIDPLADRVSD